MLEGEGGSPLPRNNVFQILDGVISRHWNDIIKKSSGQILMWDGYYYKPISQEELNGYIIEEYEKHRGVSFIDTAEYRYVTEHLFSLKERIKNSSRRYPEGLLRYSVSLDNCIFDIDAMEEIRELPDKREGVIKEYSFHRLPFSYDENARCPNWNSFLEQVFEGDSETIKMVQKYCGYILSGKCAYKKALFLIGVSGNNGKTTFIKTIQQVLGKENSIERTLTQLNKSFYVDGLEDKLLIVDSDMSCIKQTDSANFKKLTSGEPLLAEKKFGRNYEMITAGKLMMASNVVPKLSLDKGTVNRCLFAVFEKSFSANEQDRNLEPKLSSEIPGIFNWMLEGLKILKEEGLDHSVKSKDLLGEFLESNSSCEGFWQNQLGTTYVVTNNEGDYISRNRVYGDYKNYCWDSGHNKPLSENAFWKKSYAHLHLLAQEESIKRASDFFRKTGNKDVKRSYDGSQLRVVLYLKQLSI